MVASRQVEIPYYRVVGRQRGRGFGALAQDIGRIAIPILRKYVVPAAKRMVADMLELAAPEIGEVFSGRKSFKSAAKSVGNKTLRKQLGEGEGSRGRKGALDGRELAEGSRRRTAGRQGGSRKRTASRVIPTKSTKQSSRSRRDIFTNISNNSFRYEPFVAVSGNLGGKVPIVDVLSSHEQEIYPTTSLDENCIEFEFQTDRNYYVDLRQSFLALKLKFVKDVVTIHTRVRKKRSTKMSLLFSLKQEQMTKRKKK